MNKYQNKTRGMLAGLAIGDALGAPIEFLPVQNFLKEKYGSAVCLETLRRNFYRSVKANEKYPILMPCEF